eukprot:8606600-Alexandrium_andersonii.AAC.1
MELCVFRTAEVNTFSQVLSDMLESAALQPWKKRPRWTAEDMQLPAVEYGTIPEITSKPEWYRGATFYRKPGTKGQDFHNFTLEPPEFEERLCKAGKVPLFSTKAHGDAGIWNQQQCFLTINGDNQAAFGTPADPPDIRAFLDFLE